MKCLFFSIVFFLIALPSQATDYYVAPGGNDAYAGTLNNPFKNIRKAANVAQPGDTVHIRAGVYREAAAIIPANNGADGTPIIFKAYEGENVLISGLDPVASAWELDANGIHKTSIKLKLGKENANQSFDENQVFYQESEISTWIDKSRRNNHATQNDNTKRPRIGERGVVFDGTNDFFSTTVGSLTTGGFLLIAKYTIVAANNSSIALSWALNGSQGGLTYGFQNYSNTNILSLFKNANGGNSETYTNGVLIDTTTQNPRPKKDVFQLIGGNVTGNGTDSASTLRIGGNHNNSNLPTVEICELFVWTKSIPADDRQRLEGYAAHKWGITEELPADHPYRSAPPTVLANGNPWTPVALTSVMLQAWYDASDIATLIMDTKPALMLEARWPNSTGVWPSSTSVAEGAGLQLAQAGQGSDATKLVPDTDQPFGIDWTGAKLWISDEPAWSAYTKTVTASEWGELTVTGNAPWEDHQLSSKTKYYLSGVLGALDADYEWYYAPDMENVSNPGILYVKFPEATVSRTIYYKNRRYGFDLTQKSHIVLKGMRLLGCSIKTDTSSTNLTFDGLDIQYPYYCPEANGSGAQASTGLVLYGSRHILKNSELGWASGAGVRLEGDDMQIINNYIHDCDFIGTFAAPVTMGKGWRRAVISHNTITRSGRSGIAFASMPESLIQYNDISFSGLLTQDLGIIYGGRIDGGNSEVRYNWLHDNKGLTNAYGLYFDHGSKDIIMHHNVVWSAMRGINLNQYGVCLLVYNNTVTSVPNDDRDHSIVSIWGNMWQPDMYGGAIVNNVLNLEIKTADGMDLNDITIANNLTNYTGIIDNKYLPANAPGLDTGYSIPGITDIFEGSGPDMGAYEGASGSIAPNWKAGHDFANPPENINLSYCNAITRNRVKNGAFEFTDESVLGVPDWESSGDRTALHYAPDGGITQSMPLNTTKARAGFYSIKFGSGANNFISQTVTGLEGNWRYELRAQLRIDHGAAVELQIEGTSYVQSVTGEVQETNGVLEWLDTRLQFNTLPEQDEVKFKIIKTSEEGDVYVDDVSLIWVGSSSGEMPLGITTVTLPDAVVGAGYEATLAATGGKGERTWNIVADAGMLPQGLELSADGRIFGVPLATGTGAFRVRVQDSEDPAQEAERNLSLTVSPAASPDGSAVGATGGEGGGIIIVSTIDELRTWAASTSPVTIVVQGSMDLGDSPLVVASDKTIQGLSAESAILGGINLPITTSNVIINGLSIKNSAGDGIAIAGARDVYIAHCSVFDCGNNLVSITDGSSQITVAWSEFYFTDEFSGTRSAMLIGKAEDEILPITATLHHNHWSDGCKNMLTINHSDVHMYNNYLQGDTETIATVVNDLSRLFSDSNVYEGMAVVFYKEPATASTTAGGLIKTKGNHYGESTSAPDAASVEDLVPSPGYAYILHGTNDLTNLISSSAGNTVGAASFLPQETGGVSISGGNDVIANGGSFTLQANPSGVTAVSYQWSLKNTDIADAQQQKYTVESASADIHGGDYAVKIGLASGETIVSAAKTVTVLAAGAIRITQQPQRQAGAIGGGVTFTVKATSDGTGNPLLYQWRKEEEVVSSGESPNLMLSNLGASDAGTYSVIISNSFDSVTSDSAILNVYNLGSDSGRGRTGGDGGGAPSAWLLGVIFMLLSGRCLLIGKMIPFMHIPITQNQKTHTLSTKNQK
jgi:pectate lyase